MYIPISHELLVDLFLYQISTLPIKKRFRNLLLQPILGRWSASYVVPRYKLDVDLRRCDPN